MTKLKFIHPTAAQCLRVLSIALVVADLVLAYADKVAALPGVPGWLAYAWPWVLGAAVVIHQAASTFGVSPDTTTVAKLNAALTFAQSVLTVAKELQDIAATTPPTAS